MYVWHAFKCTYRVGLFGDGKAAGNLRRTTAVHNAIVTHKVAHDANRIVQGTLRLVDNLRLDEDEGVEKERKRVSPRGGERERWK